MGFFSDVAERLDDMSKVEKNHNETNSFVEKMKVKVKRTQNVIYQKATAGSYTISSDIKKRGKAIQEKYVVKPEAIAEGIIEDSKEIIESRVLVKSESKSITDEVKRMEALFEEVGGKRV